MSVSNVQCQCVCQWCQCVYVDANTNFWCLVITQCNPGDEKLSWDEQEGKHRLLFLKSGRFHHAQHRTFDVHIRTARIRITYELNCLGRADNHETTQFTPQWTRGKTKQMVTTSWGRQTRHRQKICPQTRARNQVTKTNDRSQRDQMRVVDRSNKHGWFSLLSHWYVVVTLRVETTAMTTGTTNDNINTTQTPPSGVYRTFAHTHTTPPNTP